VSSQGSRIDTAWELRRQVVEGVGQCESRGREKESREKGYHLTGSETVSE
jgi:hypothetical protein